MTKVAQCVIKGVARERGADMGSLEGRAGWPNLVIYSLAAGFVAAGVAHLLGGMGFVLAGRRTNTAAVLQILGAIAVVVAAGMVSDQVLGAVWRRVSRPAQRARQP